MNQQRLTGSELSKLRESNALAVKMGIRARIAEMKLSETVAGLIFGHGGTQHDKACLRCGLIRDGAIAKCTCHEETVHVRPNPVETLSASDESSDQFGGHV